MKKIIVVDSNGKVMRGIKVKGVRAVDNAHFNYVGKVDTVTVVSSDKIVWVMPCSQFN